MKNLYGFLLFSLLFSGCELLTQIPTTPAKITGSILFQNKSSYPYYVIMDGSSLFSNGMAGKTQFTKINVPVGDHTVKILQISGYLLKPTERTYIVKVFQGQVASLSFPY